jgi:hypothetical protein
MAQTQQEDEYTFELAERLQKLPPQEKAKVMRALREKKARELEELLERKQQELKHVEQDAAESEEELLEADEHAKEELERLLTQEESDDEKKKSITSTIPDSLYSFTNPGIYRELRSIADNVRERGYARPGEQERLEELEQQTQSLQQTYQPEQLYQADAQRNNYFTRTSDLLKQLHDDLHNLDTLNKRGGMNGSLYKL